MIEVADSNAVYYYHFDALGSVVALSDSSGDTVQTYQYSVYGQVAVEDINHPNPYMFAGRRFDIEIGLYYNRARYYNPFTGRFLQADPIGYGDGMNMYAYCTNSPINWTDLTGTLSSYADACGVTINPWASIQKELQSWKYQLARFGHFVQPVPSYPGNWNLLDYFKWYYLGGGRGVNLEQTGLLPDIQQALSYLTADIESTIIAKAKSTWSQANSFMGTEQNITLGGKKIRNYELLDADYNHPLVVLGKGNLTAKISGWIKKDGTYEITFTYQIDDPFDGVLSGGIGWAANKYGIPKGKEIKELMAWIEKYYGEIDMPYSSQYNMTAEWEVTISGSF